jgi:hypothetical protein
MSVPLAATLAARLTVLVAQPNPDQPGILAPFTVTDSNGVPISHYDIHADMGAWDDIIRKITYWPMSVAFAGARVLVGFAAWLIDWALQFELVRILFTPVNNIAEAFQSQIVDRSGYRDCCCRWPACTRPGWCCSAAVAAACARAR